MVCTDQHGSHGSLFPAASMAARRILVPLNFNSSTVPRQRSSTPPQLSQFGFSLNLPSWWILFIKLCVFHSFSLVVWSRVFIIQRFYRFCSLTHFIKFRDWPNHVYSKTYRYSRSGQESISLFAITQFWFSMPGPSCDPSRPDLAQGNWSSKQSALGSQSPPTTNAWAAGWGSSWGKSGCDWKQKAD